jgi:hypothetical protein
MQTWNDEQLRAAVAESRNTSQVLRALGLRPEGGNYQTINLRVTELHLDTRHWVRGNRVTASEDALDHVNGDRSENRLGNLRLLCPNCHALTPTYRGRNIRRKRTVNA